MSIQYFVKGIMIGLIFGMPIGAVGAMSIQRTMAYGLRAGMISGAASSVADMLYACIGAFGLTVISDFLFQYEQPIHLIGALFLVMTAVRMIKNKETVNTAGNFNGKENCKAFLSSFMVAITNPAAIVSFLFAFSVFGINDLETTAGIQLVAGVFLGTLCWWLLLTVTVNYMKQKLTVRRLYCINLFFSALLIVFSCCVVIQTL
ncbi:LysE family transporter [[Clostridium] innocuum]|nr:LysE family transporter [[Clostridium] innocuum]